MGFVEDHEIPWGLDDLLLPLLLLSEVERRDDVVSAHERIRLALRQVLRGRGVHDFELFVELRLELVLPLVLQAGGAHDQHPLDETSSSQLLENQPGLDRLAETDLVSEQHSRLQLVRDSMRHEHLVELRFDSCVGEARIVRRSDTHGGGTGH